MENTPNIGLKRWEGGDRVLHSEFNDNWDKIDAALTAKNCQIYTTTYIGQGPGIKQTLTFPHKPMAIFIMNGKWDSPFILTVGFRGAPHLLCMTNSNGNLVTSVEWGERSVTWPPCNASEIASGNRKDHSYAVLALLDPNG